MTREKPLFILQGNGSTSNRGCEAILRSTVKIIQEEFGPCRFLNSPPHYYEPEELEDLGAEVIQIMPPRRVLFSKNWISFQLRKRIFSCRLGRQIFDPTKQIFDPFVPTSVATLAMGGDNFSLDYGVPWTYFAINKGTLRHGKPLVMWGASIGPFRSNPRFESFAARELTKVTLICARESETISYLKGLGISENVRFCPDPAFILEPREICLDKPELEIIKKPCIGVNLSPLINRYWKGSQSWLECATSNIRKMLEEIDLPILFVPHVVQPNNNDYDFMKKIMRHLSSYKKRMAILGPEYRCQEIKWIVSKLTTFVGARTHSTIAALSSHVPTISIGYSMKSRGINKDIFGHLDWLVPFEKLRDDTLSNVVSRLLKSESNVRNYLTGYMPAYKEKARRAAKYFQEIIKGC
jgi:polysaccharide pyruvyl transferase WcaK-like protein